MEKKEQKKAGPVKQNLDRRLSLDRFSSNGAAYAAV